MARAYRKYEDVMEALRARIAGAQRQGQLSLPSERLLAPEIGASRMTLRKALAQAETEGSVRRDGMRTEIIPSRPPLARCGRMVFVASGCHSVFALPAIERLWARLGPAAIAEGAQLELFLVNAATPIAEWQQRLDDAAVVLTTVSAMPESALGKARVFSLLEAVPAPNGVYLDNLSVGRLAAETLLATGCARPVAISPDYRPYDNTTFHRRLQGFASVLAERGLARPDMTRLLRYPHPGRSKSEIGDRYIREAREVLETAYRDGCDGIFMVCDVDIGSIAMNLLQTGAIPDRLKLLTVNGSGDSMRHEPPISCVNHATATVVETLLRLLRLLGEGRLDAPVAIPVPPGLYWNATLGRQTGLDR